MTTSLGNWGHDGPHDHPPMPDGCCEHLEFAAAQIRDMAAEHHVYEIQMPHLAYVDAQLDTFETLRERDRDPASLAEYLYQRLQAGEVPMSRVLGLHHASGPMPYVGTPRAYFWDVWVDEDSGCWISSAATTKVIVDEFEELMYEANARATPLGQMDDRLEQG